MDKILKILIIDDDEVDRMTLIRALKNADYASTITQCADGETGFAYLQKETFDCLFLDYLLPGSDGLQMLKKIRNEGFTAPIIVITSQGDEKLAVEMMKSGATDYIVKNQINGPKIAKVLTTALHLYKIELERIAAQEALRVSESRLSEAQRIAKIGNWEIDLKEKKIFWSNEMYRIYGLDPEEFKPNLDNHLQTVHPEDRELLNKVILENQRPSIFHDFRAISHTGKLKYLNLQGYALFDADNNKEKIIGAVQDITDRKLAEKELIEAKLVAEESMKVKEQFLANMSHEIRNPMNAIMGFTDLILKNQHVLNEEHKKYINAIFKSGKNLLTLINDLLDFSKIKSGKFQLEEIDFDLYEVINGVVDLFKHKASEKEIGLEIKIAKDVPQMLIGDPVRLNQVLINLVSNAIKFTHQGNVTVRVKLIRHNQAQCLLEMNVEDSGIGISPDKVGSIFESFTQASSDTSRKYGGTGLGLAIVKSIVELQGGSVKVKSKLNQGATFIVVLPYLVQELNEIQKKPIPEVSYENEFKKSLKGKHILFAEDNEINQLLTVSILKETGCIIKMVTNGKDLVKEAIANSYDLIITDIEMPEMDGYTATKKIRSMKNHHASTIPILAMTGHALKTETTKCLEVGMNDYITKPYNASQLLIKIYTLTVKEQEKLSEDKIEELSDSKAMTDEDGRVTETTYLKKLSGNKELYNQMINLFLTQYSDNIFKLNDYFQNSNWKELKHLSHKLKSTYNLFGAFTAKDNLHMIEKECENENQDKSKIDKLLKDVISVSEKMYRELESELHTD